MPQDVQGCYYKLKGPDVILASIAAKPTKTLNAEKVYRNLHVHIIVYSVLTECFPVSLA